MLAGRIKRTASAVLLLGTGAMFQFGSGCNDRLIGITRYVDPCGTILANCEPGSFQVNRAGVGDWCVDPSCTVPGQCGDDDSGPPLGTFTNVCR